MANIDSATLNKNAFMQAFGNTLVADGVVALTVTPPVLDVIRITRVNGGTKVFALLVGSSDLDSNAAPTLAVSIGYMAVDPADGPVAVANYFAAAGDLTLQGPNAGKVYAAFAPITFEKDVYITMTVGTGAATFAAGSIFVSALGEARGIK